MSNGKRLKTPLEKVLVLGATGFIGKYFVRHLNSGTEISLLQHRKKLCEKHYRIYSGSLQSFDWNQLEEIPQVIYHFARIPGRGIAGRYAAALQSRLANLRLINWIKTLSSPPLLVYCAGTLAFGSQNNLEVDETFPLSPTSFARQYAIGEQPLIDQLVKQQIPIQIMRPAWVYGDGSWFKSFYLHPIITRKKVPLYGNGNNWMSLIHVSDVCDMIRYLSTHGPIYDTYNLFSVKPLKQIELANLLRRITGYPVERIPLNTFKSIDNALREAFTFSLKVTTRHHNLYNSYRFHHPTLESGLEQVWQVHRNNM